MFGGFLSSFHLIRTVNQNNPEIIQYEPREASPVMESISSSFDTSWIVFKTVKHSTYRSLSQLGTFDFSVKNVDDRHANFLSSYIRFFSKSVPER